MQLKIVLFQLITAFLVECPRFSQRREAVGFLCDDLGDTRKSAEEGWDLQLQINQKVVVIVWLLPPAYGNSLGVFLPVQPVGKKTGRPKAPQEFIDFDRLCLVGRVDEDAMSTLKGFVS